MSTGQADTGPETKTAATPERPPDRPGDGAETPPAAPAPRIAGKPPTSVLPQLTKILGTIVAPTTLVTSLLFYFGWSHAYWFFDRFGVNSTLLGLTAADYVMRSLDALFVPLMVVACAGLLLLWAHTLLRTRLLAGSPLLVLRVLVPVIAIVGLALAVGGFWSVFAHTVLDDHLVAAPLSLGFGVLLLVYALHLRRYLTAGTKGADHATASEGVAVAEWAGVFVLVGLSLFWAATDYSAAVGRSRAAQFVTELPSYSSALVYSSRSLSLTAPGVRQTRCRDPEAAYRFRYDGLKLVLQSGGQYLFLPEAWSRTDSVAIVMPRTDSLRLEFVPASARGTLQRFAC